MKKSNLITKTLILLLAVITYSFTTKTNNISNTVNKELFGTTKNILIVYPSELQTETKNKMRSDFLSSIGGDLINHTQCSENINAEILTVYVGPINPTKDGLIDDAQDGGHSNSPNTNNHNYDNTPLMTHAFVTGLLYAAESNDCSTGDLDFNIGR
ncbi:hypothetical protein [uncultured Tenacibaculum sp.]|uniref:hypothetical protein n=1 Tax=uncultured Tenacibaculum sp. TaxID=174713 RepID=UPI002624E828|nr:hypothetical protein [uncultured Tenacibaculum sp.]